MYTGQLFQDIWRYRKEEICKVSLVGKPDQRKAFFKTNVSCLGILQYIAS